MRIKIVLSSLLLLASCTAPVIEMNEQTYYTKTDIDVAAVHEDTFKPPLIVPKAPIKQKVIEKLQPQPPPRKACLVRLPVLPPLPKQPSLAGLTTEESDVLLGDYIEAILKRDDSIARQLLIFQKRQRQCM